MPISLPAAPAIFVYARQFADKRRVHEQRHAHAAAQRRLAGRLSGRAHPRRAPISPPPTRRKIADQSFCRLKCRPKASRPDQTTLNRLYVVEPSPSPTGGMADHHFVLARQRNRRLGLRIWPRLSVWAGRPVRQIQGNRGHRAGSASAQRRLRRGRRAIINRRTCMRWRTP